MGDLYFNELSVDFTFSVAPKDETEAKKILLQFIESYFAYKVCSGLDKVYIASINPYFIQNIAEPFGRTNFFRYIDELEVEDKISDVQKKIFKAAINESFIPDWNPEFKHMKSVAFGLGMAYQSNSYSISYSTDIINHGSTWNKFLVKIQEHKMDATGKIPIYDRLTNNITTIDHILNNHKIWEKCIFVNKKPSSVLLPQKTNTEFIVKAFSGKNWSDYYSTQQHANITIKKKIGTVIAKVNGWMEVSTKDKRLTFVARNHYLAIDKENSTYEYYIGTDEHQGEIKFHDETLNKRKAKPVRKIDLVN